MKQLILFGIVACLTGCFGTEPEKTGLEGKPLPEFGLLTDSSTWVNTRNASAGKPIALFYFSPYCPYCRAQVEEIIEDMNKLKGIQFYFVTGFPLPELKSFCKEYQLDKYPNIIAGVDTGRKVSDYFEVPGVPYMVIYGKDKKLNNTFLGKVYSSQLKKVAEN